MVPESIRSASDSFKCYMIAKRPHTPSISFTQWPVTSPCVVRLFEGMFFGVRPLILYEFDCGLHLTLTNFFLHLGKPLPLAHLLLKRRHWIQTNFDCIRLLWEFRCNDTISRSQKRCTTRPSYCQRKLHARSKLHTLRAITPLVENRPRKIDANNPLPNLRICGMRTWCVESSSRFPLALTAVRLLRMWPTLVSSPQLSAVKC